MLLHSCVLDVLVATIKRSGLIDFTILRWQMSWSLEIRLHRESQIRYIHTHNLCGFIAFTFIRWNEIVRKVKPHPGTSLQRFGISFGASHVECCAQCIGSLLSCTLRTRNASVAVCRDGWLGLDIAWVLVGHGRTMPWRYKCGRWIDVDCAAWDHGLTMAHHGSKWYEHSHFGTV